MVQMAEAMPPGSSSGTGKSYSQGSKRPEISEKEKARRKAAGLCYRCGQSGHMARQCPDGKTVQSDKKNAPPGFSLSNINFDMEALRDLTEMVDDIQDSIGLRAMSFELKLDSDDADSEDEPPDLQSASGSSESVSDEDDDELIKNECNVCVLNNHEAEHCGGMKHSPLCEFDDGEPHLIAQFDSLLKGVKEEACRKWGCDDISGIEESLADAVVRHLTGCKKFPVTVPSPERLELERFLDNLVNGLACDLWTTPETLSEDDAMSICSEGEKSDSDDSASDSDVSMDIPYWGKDPMVIMPDGNVTSVPGRDWGDFIECANALEREMKVNEEDGDTVPYVIALPPLGRSAGGRPIINLWDVPVKPGLQEIENALEIEESWVSWPEEPIPMNEMHPVPRRKATWAEKSGSWFYRSWVETYPRCVEERGTFVDSFGDSRDPRPRVFGDTVAQNAMWLLDTHGPYPGDHHLVLRNWCELVSPMGRFR